MALEIASLAPDFALYDTEKRLIHLSDYAGKNVLLLFFPLAFSSVCTAELCSVRDSIASYEVVDTQVMGISVDSLYALASFKKSQQINFPLLSDFNKKVSALYDVLYQQFSYDMEGVSKRAAFIIDKKGKIAYAEILENAGEQPDFAAIQTTLSSLV